MLWLKQPCYIHLDMCRLGTIVPSNVPWPWQSVVHGLGAKVGAALKPGAKLRAASKLVLASLGDVTCNCSIPKIITVNCDSC